ncbi:UBIQP protein, partial [Thalassarche chlororhynchos]|nr:UBIQP protein [Thalassarche chlororhynchos]
MAEQQAAADSPGKFCIFVKTLIGKTFTVPVSLDDSVWELKAKLNAQDSSLTPEGGRLVYNNRQMNDDLTLRDYEITPNCFLYHISRSKCRVVQGRWVRIRHALVLTDNLVQWGWWSCMVVSIGPQLTAWW